MDAHDVPMRWRKQARERKKETASPRLACERISTVYPFGASITYQLSCKPLQSPRPASIRPCVEGNQS